MNKGKKIHEIRIKNNLSFDEMADEMLVSPETIIKSEFGGRIQELREDRGLTQQELAKILGVRREVVAKWETGLQDIKTYYTIKLAQFFNVTTDYLLGVSDVKVSDTSEPELKAICNYTGLSEQAVECIKNCNNDFLNTLSIALKIQKQDVNIQCSLNDFVSDEHFLEMIYYISKMMYYTNITYKNLIAEFKIESDDYDTITENALKYVEEKIDICKYNANKAFIKLQESLSKQFYDYTLTQLGFGNITLIEEDSNNAQHNPKNE